jgi:hypothetical protein
LYSDITRKGNGSVWRHVILLENLRINTRDPGQYMLVKQRLVGISCNPFPFSVFLTMATCLSGQRSVSSILGLAFNSLQILYTFQKHFDFKQDATHTSSEIDAGDG